MKSKLILLTILLGASVDRSRNARLEADQINSVAKRTEKLDESGRVILSWEPNEDETEVTFELWANTTGFVAFGISPQGGMAGADIFIAGVAPGGLPYSSDRFAPASQTPRVDEHEDWTLLESSENETTTYLKFSRALYTCDEDEDFPITNGTNRVIWALGGTDNLEKHLDANRGTRSISLLSPASPQLNETMLETWEVILDMEMPSGDTSYWCSLHKGPPTDRKNYVIGRLTFPKDVAYPMEQDALNKTKYLLLETHYDNPQKVHNLSFATGVQIFYTSVPRTHEAALLVIIHASTLAITIPPNTTNFVVAAQCGSACTADRLHPDGILVFNSLLHTHISGRKLKLRHFREGVELPWIDYDDHYDFNFQQTKHLREPVKILPGDHLTNECTYDSTWNGGRVVTGGSATWNEMCQAFLWYYPKLDDLTFCGSTYNYKKNFADFNITKWNSVINGSQIIHYIEEPEYLIGEYDDSMSYKFNWTEGFKKEFQERRRYSDHDMLCYGDPKNSLHGIVNYPKNFIEFVPKDFCAKDNSRTTDDPIISTDSNSTSAAEFGIIVAFSTILLSLFAAITI